MMVAIRPSDALLVINDIAENGPRAMEVKQLELHVNIFDLDGNEIQPDASGNIIVAEDEIFEIEIGYTDLRTNFANIGAFQLWVDLLADQPDILEPVVTETQEIEFDIAGTNNLTSGTFTIGREGTTDTYTTQEFTGSGSLAAGITGRVNSGFGAIWSNGRPVRHLNRFLSDCASRHG